MEGRGGGGAALPQKSVYWVSSISISFGPSLSERGMNTGANHTGLHSITISLCCHGSRALSRVKISHCTKRGLMSEHTYEHVCTHVHTLQPLEREVTGSSCFDPVTHSHIASLAATCLSAWLSSRMPMCSWLQTITGVSMCESVQVSDSTGPRGLSAGQICCSYLSFSSCDLFPFNWKNRKASSMQP